MVWLFAGNIVGFDKTPWPLLLTLLNLPQLSIMISLQVSANRAQAASDARAMADHATLVALHELSKKQVQILDGQNKVLDILEHAVVTPDGPPAGAEPAGPAEIVWRRASPAGPFGRVARPQAVLLGLQQVHSWACSARRAGLAR